MGKEIADSLTILSLDLCGIICRYLMYDVAKKDKKPSQINFLKVPNIGNLFNMAINSLDHIICTFYDGIRVFKQDYHFDFAIHNQQSIAVNSFGTIFTSNFITKEIKIFSSSGTFRKTITNKDVLSLVSDDRGYVYTLTHQPKRIPSGQLFIEYWNDNGEMIKSIPHPLINHNYLVGINLFNQCLIFAAQGDKNRLYLFNTLTGKIIQENLFLDCAYIAYITMDRNGNFYCLETSYSDKVKILDTNQKQLTSFAVDKASCICIDKQGKIYVREKDGVRVFAFEF